MKILFNGTGTSGCVPSIACLLNKSLECQVCPEAHSSKSFNHRLNTSAVISSDKTNILIDCGKTFLWQSLSLFPKHNIDHLDALLLTHEHADAILGLDDLRGWTMNKAIQEHIHVYCDASTFKYVSTVFPYLVDKQFASGGGDVPSLIFHVFEHETIDEDGYTTFKSFYINQVKVTPFHVRHGSFKGAPYYACGFIIDDIVYVSDVSFVPEKTMKLLCDQPYSAVVVDALHEKPHPSHFSFRQSLEFLFQLNVKCGLLTGFTHRVDQWYMQQGVDSVVTKFKDGSLTDDDYKVFEYDKSRPVVKSTEQNFNWSHNGLFVKLAYDGLQLDFGQGDSNSISLLSTNHVH